MNNWSCLPAAFALAIGMDVHEFIKHIGHDGSKIVWPMLKEPACRRGFHTQECLSILYRAGFTATPFEAIPQHVPAFTVPAIPILFGGSEETAMKRFSDIIHLTKGVITGTSLVGHAVAYERGIVYEPRGACYAYSPQACESRGFIGTCAWSIK